MFYGVKCIFIVNVSDAKGSFEFLTFFLSVDWLFEDDQQLSNFFWNQPVLLVDFIKNLFSH